jgi:hypothetical protein
MFRCEDPSEPGVTRTVDPLPPPSPGVHRLMGRAPGPDLVELAGIPQAAEDGRDGARVHRPLQLVAVAAVGLGGHPAGSEGLAVPVAADHTGDQLAGPDPLAHEFAEVLRLFHLGRCGRHGDPGQIRRRERRRLEGLEVLSHFVELCGVRGALLAMMGLLLLVEGHLLLVMRDPGLQLRQDLRHRKRRAHLRLLGRLQRSELSSPARDLATACTNTDPQRGNSGTDREE